LIHSRVGRRLSLSFQIPSEPSSSCNLLIVMTIVVVMLAVAVMA
jgi:hypothetical protein